jgi:hypothetical protein
MKIPEGWPTEEMIDAAWRGYTGGNATEKLTRAVTSALAAAPTPPAQELVPVAWLVNTDWGSSFHRQKPNLNLLPGKLKHMQPLYTAPQSDKLRKAAEEVYEEFQRKIAHGDNGAQLLDALENLRAALEER